MRAKPRKHSKKNLRACGKRRFRDHEEAIAALRLVRERGGRSVTPARCYACDRCGGWHLTSKP